MTAVAIEHFTAQLDAVAAVKALPSAVVDQLVANGDRLAGVYRSADVPVALEPLVRQVVADAYTSTFAVLSLFNGAMAVLGGLVARFTLGTALPGKPV